MNVEDLVNRLYAASTSLKSFHAVAAAKLLPAGVFGEEDHVGVVTAVHVVPASERQTEQQY